MPARGSQACISAEEIDRVLPRTFFVRRGDIISAFGLSNDEFSALVDSEVFKAEYLPPNKRRRKKAPKTTRAAFVRTQVMAVAYRWEGCAS